MRYKTSNIIIMDEYRNPGRGALGVLSLAHRLPHDYGKERVVSHSLHGLPEGSHAVFHICLTEFPRSFITLYKKI
jgi:hypothetical protein